MNILIIGGTGFIGQRLVRRLHQQGQTLFLLVRPQSLEKAQALFSDLKNLTFLRGDIKNTDLLSDVSQAKPVTDQIECVINLAAIYRLNVTPTEAYIMNVVGTQNVLKFLTRLTKLRYFHYFSTYAVNQVLDGEIKESELIDENATFFDQYARSKNHAEHLVRKLTPKHISTTIHRPGIIVGDSQTGERDKDDGPYYFFNFIQKTKQLGRLAEKCKILPLPVTEDSRMPVLPVDTLVDWSTQIILSPQERALSCYHLIPKEVIKTKDFLQLSIDLLKSPLKIVGVPLVRVFPPVFRLLRLPVELVFYMKQRARLDRSELERDYPNLKNPDYRNYLPILIEAFMKKEK